MRVDELERVCTDAARDLARREDRPLPAAVVLPLPEATRITTFPDFPDDDGARHDLLRRFAEDVARPANAPCFGFVAEGSAASEAGPVDVVVVAFGARGHAPMVTAAPLSAEGPGDFSEAEELDAAALPFLAPLRHAVDAATPSGVPRPPGVS